MKILKNQKITAIYEGKQPFNSLSNRLTVKKYIGYDHLFKNVEGNSFMYSEARARKIPYEIRKGTRVLIVGNFKSSLITSIKSIKKL
jgi:hypothetical protein